MGNHRADPAKPERKPQSETALPGTPKARELFAEHHLMQEHSIASNAQINKDGTIKHQTSRTGTVQVGRQSQVRNGAAAIMGKTGYRNGPAKRTSKSGELATRRNMSKTSFE